MGLSKSGDALLHVNTNFWGGTVKSKKTDRSACLLLALRQSETRADAFCAVSVIVNEGHVWFPVFVEVGLGLKIG